MPFSSRRKFLRNSLLSTFALPFGLSGCQSGQTQPDREREEASSPIAATSPPIVLSTWNMGVRANDTAWEVLEKGGRALDAVEAGLRLIEADPKVSTVGYGATPDRDGRVTLDACIMDDKGNAGSVSCIQHIMHPVSVARKVMEETPHVMLVGDGALQFALSQGFSKEELLTDASRQRWEQWKQKAEYTPEINVENHDTIGMLAMDKSGALSGGCTTSGIGFKLPGRVGDSPIIGAGLFVDNEVGAATATGLGELVLKTLGCFLIVELMRQGKSPSEACRIAVERIIQKYPEHQKAQVGFIALNKAGEFGGHSIQKGFGFAVCTKEKNEMYSPDFTLK
jgi:N4-(beta-N-acetylglucosaminyl)-L-asparaginase